MLVFSAIAVIEGQLAKKTGTYLSFSDQQLVTCDIYDAGCNGGDPWNAFTYILSTPSKGINTDSAYPVKFILNLELYTFFHVVKLKSTHQELRE